MRRHDQCTFDAFMKLQRRLFRRCHRRRWNAFGHRRLLHPVMHKLLPFVRQHENSLSQSPQTHPVCLAEHGGNLSCATMRRDGAGLSIRAGRSIKHSVGVCQSCETERRPYRFSGRGEGTARARESAEEKRGGVGCEEERGARAGVGRERRRERGERVGVLRAPPPRLSRGSARAQLLPIAAIELVVVRKLSVATK